MKDVEAGTLELKMATPRVKASLLIPMYGQPEEGNW